MSTDVRYIVVIATALMASMAGIFWYGVEERGERREERRELMAECIADGHTAITDRNGRFDGCVIEP